MNINKSFTAVAVTMTLLIGQAFGQAGVNQLAEVSSAEAATRITSGDSTALTSALTSADVTSDGPSVPSYLLVKFISNSFLGDNKVLTLDSSNRLMMATKDKMNPRQQWHVVEGNNGYIHLWNQALGEVLRVDSDTTKPHMAKSGNYSGQFWALEDARNGWVRISNAYQGRDKVLDTYNGTGNYVFFEAKAKNTSGTFWKVVQDSVPNPDYVAQTSYDYVPLQPQ
ncbi:RICIN domain-containing protein [Marinobacter caseinilyticus]|uniref:RICIN domain-containing protein n=1 Tax=Marinobacter caseinilyticus TaxID=2692195 RepID=UPI001409D3C2|nr:RICIN domain-containing protein [Marinobacter caseinilyticus]